MSLLKHPTAQALLADTEVSAAAVAGCRLQLQCFLQRYLPRFYRSEQHDLARVVLEGKLSNLQRKTAEPIAYHAGPYDGAASVRRAIARVHALDLTSSAPSPT